MTQKPNIIEGLYVENFNSHRKYSWEESLNQINQTYSWNKEYEKKIIEDLLWMEIRALAASDEELERSLDRVKILYYLKKNGNR